MINQAVVILTTLAWYYITPEVVIRQSVDAYETTEKSFFVVYTQDTVWEVLSSPDGKRDTIEIKSTTSTSEFKLPETTNPRNLHEVLQQKSLKRPAGKLGKTLVFQADDWLYSIEDYSKYLPSSHRALVDKYRPGLLFSLKNEVTTKIEMVGEIDNKTGSWFIFNELKSVNQVDQLPAHIQKILREVGWLK